MMNRCYNENDGSYRVYGGNGVTIESSWHEFDNFSVDATELEGWDKEKFMKTEIVLDKDIKYKGNKTYSRETCMWVSPEENTGFRPNFMDKKLIKKPSGEVEVFYSTADITRRYDLTSEGVLNALRGNQSHHKYYQFRYADEVENNPFLEYYEAIPTSVVAYGPDKETIRAESGAEFLRKIDLDPRSYRSAVSETIQGKKRHVKGWQVQRLKDYDPNLWKDPKSFKGRRDVERLGKSPDGEVYEFTNIKEFCKDFEELDHRRVSDCLNGVIKQTKGWAFKYK